MSLWKFETCFAACHENGSSVIPTIFTMKLNLKYINLNLILKIDEYLKKMY